MDKAYVKDATADKGKGEEALLGAANLQLSEDDNVLVQGVEGDKNAIGYFGFAYFAENEGKLQDLGIEGVAPTAESVDAGEYKLARPLFIYSDAKIMQEKPQVADFINFYLTSVNDVIGPVGYFPAPADALERLGQGLARGQQVGSAAALRVCRTACNAMVRLRCLRQGARPHRIVSIGGDPMVEGSGRMQTPRVLFLCTANSARSQMAEALLRKHADAYFEAYSAGIEPGELNPLTVQVLSEIGIDASGQWAKSVEFYRGKMHCDYVITVCSNADQRCPFFPATTARLHWPFDDPAMAAGSEVERLAAFRRVRDEIENKVLFWIGTLGLERHGSKVNVH